jgi:ABC-type polysaccharide/polyol phosphate transport system ATPase subunit
MPIIQVDHLTKEYRLGAMQGLKQTLLNSAARLTGKKVEAPPLFKALDDVNFSIKPGEVVGIIGHNGAGKSTLLKMLAKISTPTHGSVKVDGRIAPLIEVGAGFVPDFTGRENVYLNGAILGLSRQDIDKKFDEIVDFAEMEEFIDTPVKRYSSGMQVKLAFAVATSIEAEILIVDEVLAVGDLAFQRKCFDRMEDLIKRQGRSVLLVSHNIRQVQRLCHRVILLDHGRVLEDGNPREVCDHYYAQNDNKVKNNIKVAIAREHSSSGEMDLIDLHFVGKDGLPTNAVIYNQNCELIFRIKLNNDLADVTFGFGFHTTDFLYLTTHNSEEQLKCTNLACGEHIVACKILALPLLPGVYSLRFGVTAGKAARVVFYAENLLNFQVVGEVPITVRDGFFALDAKWIIPSNGCSSEINKLNFAEIVL